MGAVINEIYKIVTEKAGFKGRMRLAVRTGVSRTKAAQMEDTPSMIKKFQKAAEEIISKDLGPLLKRR